MDKFIKVQLNEEQIASLEDLREAERVVDAVMKRLNKVKTYHQSCFSHFWGMIGKEYDLTGTKATVNGNTYELIIRQLTPEDVEDQIKNEDDQSGDS